MSIDFQKFSDELRCSGVSIASQYLGSVPVFESINSMVSDMRMQLINECILHVAAKAGVIEAPDPINPVIARIVGEIEVTNKAVELNITSKMIKVIHNTRLIQRHPFTYFSLGTQGQPMKTDKMFGYVAKNNKGEDRRCHVFASKDYREIQKLIDVLSQAINVNTFDSPKRDANGFVTPTVPLKTRNGEFRQSFVSNVPPQPVRPATVHDDVTQQAWYHGNLSRECAQALLTTPGDFLVRQSDHTPGQYVLSGKVCDNEHKHLILLDAHQRVRTRDRQFNNISELIEYHMSNGMAVRSEGNDQRTSLNLIRPIPHPDTPTPSVIDA